MSTTNERSTETSWAKYEHYRQFVATGSGTMSKRPGLKPDEPCYIDHGKGCRVWDVDGNEYIDYRNSLGPITLGYCFPAIDEAVQAQLKKGIIFGHPSILEGEVAELLVEVIPCAEKVRYLKTGGEALAAAIKMARAATGRDLIAQCGYNGWVNSLAAGANVLPRVREDVPVGVPLELSKLHRAMPWGDLDAYEKLFAEQGDQFAAVIVAMDYLRPELAPEFLSGLRELTRKHGILLMIDEIVTGFRVAIGGLHEYCDVDIDAAVFAKGIANGMPLSVIVGKSDLMETFERAVVSSTLSGESLSLAAAKAAIGVYKEHNVVGHIAEKGAMLQDGLNELFERHNYPIQSAGHPACPPLAPCPERAEAPMPDAFPDFFRAAYQHGVSLYNVCYTNFSHAASDIQETLDRLDAALGSLK